MRLLIAGHTGFIGRNLLRAVLNTGIADQVLCISRTASCPEESGVACARLDLADTDLRKLEDAVRGFAPDAVVNCAGSIVASVNRAGSRGESSTGRDAEVSSVQGSLLEAIRENILATANLLGVLNRVAREVRFIHMGTAAEYGQAVSPPHAIREDCTPVPDSVYGITKLTATRLVLLFGRRKGIMPTVLRVFNPIGPDISEATLVGRVIGMLRDPFTRTQELFTFGSLGAFRDFVDIQDVVSAILMALRDRTMSVGEVVNIGSGQAVLARDLVTKLLACANSHCRMVETADPAGRSPGVVWSKADIDKAKRVLGWSPQRTLEQTIQWIVQVGRLGAPVREFESPRERSSPRGREGC